jgi:RNA polymerase sigma factor (TIGR02999 family)
MRCLINSDASPHNGAAIECGSTIAAQFPDSHCPPAITTAMEPSVSTLDSGKVTRLISEIDAGNQLAQSELCDLVYSELRAIGQGMRKQGPDCSLATTDVVHEFLGRVIADGRLGQMKNRRYLFSAAADQMRRLIVDHWRRKRTLAGGGNRKREELDPWLDELTESAASHCGGDLEALDIALNRLRIDRPRQFEIVQLKFFAELTNDEIADTLLISIDTVKREWKRARARLGASLIE